MSQKLQREVEKPNLKKVKQDWGKAYEVKHLTVNQESWWFESTYPREFFGPVAQLVESN